MFVDAPPTGADGGKFVKFAPLIAGSAPVNFDAVSVDILASATVPVKLPAGIFVKFAPEPENVVAVRIPVTTAPVLVVVNF